MQVEYRDRGLECPICIDPYENPKTIASCKHVFCAACVEILPHPKTCPLCRERFTVRDLIDNDEIIQKINELKASTFPEPEKVDSSEILLHTSLPHQLVLQSAQQVPFKSENSFKIECYLHLYDKMTFTRALEKFDKLKKIRGINQNDFFNLYRCIYVHPEIDTASLKQIIYLLDQFMVPKLQRLAISILANNGVENFPELNSISNDDFATILFYAIRYGQSKVYECLMTSKKYTLLPHNDHKLQLYIWESLYSENLKLFCQIMKHSSFKDISKRLFMEFLDLIEQRQLCNKELGWRIVKEQLNNMCNGVAIDDMESKLSLAEVWNKVLHSPQNQFGIQFHSPVVAKPKVAKRSPRVLCCDIL